jgi:hypothetical protein
MNSRRLNDDEKAKLVEHATLQQEEMLVTNRFIDPNDGSEFHEGMASGLLLAVEIIQSCGGLNATSASAIAMVVARCIQETKPN